MDGIGAQIDGPFGKQVDLPGARARCHCAFAGKEPADARISTRLDVVDGTLRDDAPSFGT